MCNYHAWQERTFLFNLDFYTSVTCWSGFSMTPGWKCEFSPQCFAAGSQVPAAAALWNAGGEDFRVALTHLSVGAFAGFQLQIFPNWSHHPQRVSCSAQLWCDSLLLASGYILRVHQSWLFRKNTAGNWYVCRWERHVFLSETREGEEHRMKTICFPNWVFCVCIACIFIFLAYIERRYMYVWVCVYQNKAWGPAAAKHGRQAWTRPHSFHLMEAADMRGRTGGVRLRRSIKPTLAPERLRSNTVGTFEQLLTLIYWRLFEWFSVILYLVLMFYCSHLWKSACANKHPGTGAFAESELIIGRCRPRDQAHQLPRGVL